MEARIPNFEDDGPSSNATTDGIVAGGSSRVPVDGVPGLRAGAENGGGLLGLPWVSSPDQDMQAASDSSFKYCPPTPARIMRGNRNNIGSLNGGWGPQHPVTAAGAAVDPAQWGGKAALRPYLDQISGVLADGIPLFQGVSEVVGGKAETIKGKTYDAAHVRDGIKAAYPGQLLLEIPNQNDMGTKMVVLRVPRDLNCPRPWGEAMQSGSRTVAVIVVVAAAAFSAGAAQALCIYNGDLYAKTTLSQEFRDSALVVRARVVSSRTVDSESDVSDPLEIDVIQPVEFFKGRVKGKVTYYTWHNSGGFYVTPGKDYLLFLDRTGAGAYGKGRQAGFDINYNCGQSMEWTAVDDDARSKLAKLARQRPEAH